MGRVSCPILPAILALIMMGCAGVDIGPSPSATTPRQPMTVLEARRTFDSFKDDLVQGTSGMVARGFRELRDMSLRSDGIEVAAVWRTGPFTAKCPFARLAPRVQRSDKEYYLVFGECTSSRGQAGLLAFLFRHQDQATVERFADALIVIRTSGPAVAAVSDVNEPNVGARLAKDPQPASASRPPEPAPPPVAQPSTASGSGFLLRQTNLILTNYHVVRDRKELTLRTRSAPGSAVSPAWSPAPSAPPSASKTTSRASG